MVNMIQGDIHKGVLKTFNIKKMILLKRQCNTSQEKLQYEERGHVMPDTVALYRLLQSLAALYLQNCYY